MDQFAMGRDAEVLQQVIQTHGLTIAQVANRSGYAEKTLYRYLSDDGRTLPSEVIRAVFELTLDNRLIRLITGLVPGQWVIALCGGKCPGNSAPTASPARVPPIQDLLPKTCESVEQAAKSVKYVAQIISDGSVDESDKAAMSQFSQHANRAIANLTLTLSALKEYERNMA